MATSMRGLTQVSLIHLSCHGHATYHVMSKFIADIRGARVRELEEKRINKEMANIRKRFKGRSLVSLRRSPFIHNNSVCFPQTEI